MEAHCFAASFKFTSQAWGEDNMKAALDLSHQHGQHGGDRYTSCGRSYFLSLTKRLCVWWPIGLLLGAADKQRSYPREREANQCQMSAGASQTNQCHELRRQCQEPVSGATGVR